MTINEYMIRFEAELEAQGVDEALRRELSREFRAHLEDAAGNDGDVPADFPAAEATAAEMARELPDSDKTDKASGGDGDWGHRPGEAWAEWGRAMADSIGKIMEDMPRGMFKDAAHWGSRFGREMSDAMSPLHEIAGWEARRRMHAWDRETVRGSMDASGIVRLRVFLSGGDVECRPAQGSELEWEAELPRGMTLETFLRREGDSLACDAGDFRRGMKRLRLGLPDGMRFLESTLGGGNIKIEDLALDAELKSGGGDIEIKNLKGALRASTAGGEIRVEGHVGALDLNSNAGNLEITECRGEIRARTLAGNLRIERPAGGFAIRGETNAGNLELRLERGAAATVHAVVTAGNLENRHGRMRFIREERGIVGCNCDLEADGAAPGPEVWLRSSAGNIRIEED